MPVCDLVYNVIHSIYMLLTPYPHVSLRRYSELFAGESVFLGGGGWGEGEGDRRDWSKNIYSLLILIFLFCVFVTFFHLFLKHFRHKFINKHECFSITRSSAQSD